MKLKWPVKDILNPFYISGLLAFSSNENLIKNEFKRNFIHYISFGSRFDRTPYVRNSIVIFHKTLMIC